MSTMNLVQIMPVYESVEIVSQNGKVTATAVEKQVIEVRGGGSGAKTFVELTDAPDAYTGQASKVVKIKADESGLEFSEIGPSLPAGGILGQILTKQSSEDGDAAWEDPVDPLTQATETTLGGIKAKAKTTESAEIAIDGATGKLYAPASSGGGGGIGIGNVVVAKNESLVTITDTDTTILELPITLEETTDLSMNFTAEYTPKLVGATPDAYTKLILPCDGVDGSTSFTDVIGHTVTAAGNAYVSTSAKKFGTGSLKLDGSGDYVSIPYSADFDFGTGDFTIDFWMNLITSGNDRLIMSSAANGGWFIGQTNGNIGIGRPAVAWDTQFNGSFATNVWDHFEITRASGVIYIFKNGNLLGSAANTIAYNLNSSALLIGGGNGAYYINSYLDEVRISKGVGRHTAAFTPETVPYSGTSPTEVTFKTFIDDVQLPMELTESALTVDNVYKMVYSDAIKSLASGEHTVRVKGAVDQSAVDIAIGCANATALYSKPDIVEVENIWGGI